MKPIWRILLIEDNVDDAHFIEEAIMKSNGMATEITRVDTREGLISAIENKYFDFILSDITVPGLPFIEILQILEYYDLGLPVIIVTGSISSEEVSKLLGLQTHYIYVSKSELWQIGPILKHAIEAENAQFETIQVLVHAMEYKDHITSAHSNRVVELTIETAHEMKISERKVREMRTGALLHDVGKMAIPDSILLKSGVLSDSELEVMRTHPQLGYDLLSKSKTLKKFSEIAYCHHERWNGNGYPRGLMGTEIPISARIFAVVDVYDALSSDRPYRPAWEKERVIEYLLQEKSISFDPDIVDVFVNMIGRG